MKSGVLKFKNHMRKYSTSKKINGIIFVLPWLIGFFMFFAIPLVNTIIYSFSQVSVKDAGGMAIAFTGIQNYIDLFQLEVSTQNQQMLRVFTDENVRIITNIPLVVIFSLFLALLVNAKFKGRGVVRVIFFLPIVLGLDVVVSMLSVNMMGEVVQTASTDVFAGASFAEFFLKYTFLPVEIIIFIQAAVNNIFSLITQAGVQTLIFLAGLQSINPSLYEVAKIEGATTYETFWKVTIPLIANITFFVSIYTLVDLFLRSSIAQEIYNFAFIKSKIGIGSALSVIFMMNAVVLLLILVWLLKRVVKLDYGN